MQYGFSVWVWKVVWVTVNYYLVLVIFSRKHVNRQQNSFSMLREKVRLRRRRISWRLGCRSSRRVVDTSSHKKCLIWWGEGGGWLGFRAFGRERPGEWKWMRPGRWTVSRGPPGCYEGPRRKWTCYPRKSITVVYRIEARKFCERTWDSRNILLAMQPPIPVTNDSL